MDTLTGALLAELPPLQRLMLRQVIGSLTPAEQAEMEAALTHVVLAKRNGDGRPFMAILRDWLLTREGAGREGA